MIRISTGLPVPVRKRGYTNIGFGRHVVGLHRVKFALKHGFVPPFVDHRDGNPANNALGNLRAATRAQNMRNQPNVHSRRALPRGVYIRPSGKYQGKAWDGKRYRVLGSFRCPTAASFKVEAFLKKHHGEFYVSPTKG